jgi:hypothetical protein
MSNLTNHRPTGDARTATRMIFVCLALLLAAIHHGAVNSATAASPSPSPSDCLPATTTAWESNRVIYQEFPARGPTETAWIVVWTEYGHRGLWIASAWFRPKPSSNFFQVLGQSGLSQIFVPYHDGLARLYDLNPWTDVREAVPAYTGPCGTISGPF